MKKCKPGKDMKMASMPYSGKTVHGVMLDESRGRPVGSIAVFGQDFKYVSKERS